MTPLPLKPEDITEFTCDAANELWSSDEDSILDSLENFAPDCNFIETKSLRNNAISAEWTHRIASHAADGADEAQVVAAARAYVAWQSSLKGGGNG